MGKLAVAEELASSDELDELYKLDMSETEPEDEQDDEEDEGIKPEEMPHG